MISLVYIVALVGITIMVSSDTGLPDPDNPNDEVRVSNEVILVTDDDEDSDDQETIVLEEYQPLPMEDSIDANHSSSEDEAYGHQNANITVTPLPSIASIEDTLVNEVWSGPVPKTCDIEMDSKKVDEVKQVMMNITLPPSSIPEWATNIPEDEWKSQLMKRLQNMHADKK